MIDVITPPEQVYLEQDSEPIVFLAPGSNYLTKDKQYLVVALGPSEEVNSKGKPKFYHYLASELTSTMLASMSAGYSSYLEIFKHGNDTIFHCFENPKSNEIVKVSSYYKDDLPEELFASIDCD